MEFNKKYLNMIIEVAKKYCDCRTENKLDTGYEWNQNAFQILEQCYMGSGDEKFEIKDRHLYYLNLFLDLEISDCTNYPDTYDLDIDKELLVELRGLIRDRR